MHLVVRALCAVIVLAGASACASEQRTGTPALDTVQLGDFAASIESLEGVSEASLTPSSSDVVDLVVQLDEAVNAQQLGAIGTAVRDFRAEELPAGTYPGQIELRLGESVYAYFSVPGESGLQAQLAYWLALSRSGVAAVAVRTYSAPLSGTLPTASAEASDPAVDASPDADAAGEPAAASRTPQPTFSNSPVTAPLLLNAATGRSVAITVPGEASDEQFAEIVRAIRSTPDPGAALGEWQVLGLPAALKIAFAGSVFPDEADVAATLEITGVLSDAGETANAIISVDRAQEPARVEVEVIAFDGALDEATSQNAQEYFERTSVWPQLFQVLETLDGLDTDFQVTVTSNPLQDSGYFRLDVAVEECHFLGDEAWPSLSVDLGEHWLTVHQQRHPGAVDCLLEPLDG